MISLIVYIVSLVLSIFADIFEISILRKASVEGVSDTEALIDGIIILLTSLFGFLVFVVTVILFAMWIHRAYRNVMVLNNDKLKYSPGWAVGWYFIPIAHLFMPFLVMREIWKGSSPDVDLGDKHAWQKERGSALLGFWWGVWIFHILMSNVAHQVYWEAETFDQYITANGFYIFSNIIGIILTILAFFVVYRINQRQTEKRKRLEAYYRNQSDVNNSHTSPQTPVQTPEGTSRGLGSQSQEDVSQDPSPMPKDAERPQQFQEPNPTPPSGNFVWKK